MKPKMKLLRKRLERIWRPLLASVAAASLAAFALLWQLGSLAPRLSPDEAATRASSIDLLAIVHNPQNAPYRLLLWATTHLPQQWGFWTTRVPSVVFALGALALLIFLLRRWYGRRTMLFGFAVVVCSAWLLHIGRFAGTDIEYFTAIPALLAVHVGLHDKEESTKMFFLWLVTNIVLLFIPGMLWFVLMSMALQPIVLAHAWRALASWWQRAIAIAVAIAGFMAPVLAIVYHPSSWTSWLALPSNWHDVRSIPQYLLEALGAIGFHGPHDPQLWLGRLPILDVFLLVALAAGVAFYMQHWQAARSQLLAAYLALGLLLVSCGVVSLSVVVPVCYLIIAAGIAYLLHFWLRAFPLNPMARGLGIGLMSVVVALSCYYNVVQYFVAWPHNAEVSAVYQR